MHFATNIIPLYRLLLKNSELNMRSASPGFTLDVWRTHY